MIVPERGIKRRDFRKSPVPKKKLKPLSLKTYCHCSLRRQIDIMVNKNRAGQRKEESLISLMSMFPIPAEAECCKDNKNIINNSIKTIDNKKVETATIEKEVRSIRKQNVEKKCHVVPIAKAVKENSIEVTLAETEIEKLITENVEEDSIEVTLDETDRASLKGVEEQSCAELSDDNMVLAVPVVRQTKVGIKFNIKSTMMPMKTLDSSDSTTTEEESEFDKDAIVVPGPDQEARNTKKPRMKGKRFAEWPVINADKDQSALCSIM